MLSGVFIGALGLALILSHPSSKSSVTTEITQEENSKNNFLENAAADFNSNVRVLSTDLDSFKSEMQKSLETLKAKVEEQEEQHSKDQALIKALKKDASTPKPSTVVAASNDKATTSKYLSTYRLNHIENTLPEKSLQTKPASLIKGNYIELGGANVSAVGGSLEAPKTDTNPVPRYLPNSGIMPPHVTEHKKGDGLRPYYTIPAGSDVQNTTLLTSLIGEVPLNGKVQQPFFPFSAMISKGELMSANHVPLPSNLIGMKVGGYAIGVGSFLDNISCVRAYVTSALFVFSDGHFVTVGESKNNQSASETNSLGYLTDKYGSPCIHGSYHTNAPRVLMALTASGAVSGMGNAISQWEQSTTYGGGGITQVPSGNFTKFAGGQALSTGFNQSSEWLKNRISDSFDIVFVPASIPYKAANNKTLFKPNRLGLHFTQTLNIDKDNFGRRIRYDQEKSLFNAAL